MLLSVILLSISTSIDSFGIGITYGLRNLKITNFAKLVLFLISICITYFSILIGKNLTLIFSPLISKIIGASILIIMGLAIIFQIFRHDNKKVQYKPKKNQKLDKKIYKFFIKFLGITIQIIKDPLFSDLDSSCIIDTKEALYLGFSLSLDSFCIGISVSILGYSLILFPILVSLFQLVFLSIGTFIGKHISKKTNIPDNVWNLISATFLIIIGISRLF